ADPRRVQPRSPPRGPRRRRDEQGDVHRARTVERSEISRIRRRDGSGHRLGDGAALRVVSGEELAARTVASAGGLTLPTPQPRLRRPDPVRPDAMLCALQLSGVWGGEIVRGRRSYALVAVVLLWAASAIAQQIGSIAGLVTDASGSVLPGVTVEASSPALIEKVRTTVTDGTGQYR